MKAVTYNAYGSPDVLEVTDLDVPKPKDNELLIKLEATSINSWDFDLIRGKPYIVRAIGGGLFKPKMILGCDVAGVVEAVGSEVSNFKKGDRVFGDISSHGWGGFAEYVCAPDRALSIIPNELGFIEAAAIPQAGVMALQGVRDYQKVYEGQHVLINGAGGGVGSFAIQLAKQMNAEVTGVDHKSKQSFMKSLGADHVIDYTSTDFTREGNSYDLILDVVGHHSIWDYKRSLKADGLYRMIGGHSSLMFQAILLGPIISMFGNKKLGILPHDHNKYCAELVEMVAKKDLQVHVDRTFPLDQIGEAFHFFGSGAVQGKVVITSLLK